MGPNYCRKKTTFFSTRHLVLFVEFVERIVRLQIYLYQGCKKPGTERNPGQELMQKKGAMCPPFIHYLTPSAPIETDEVTLHSVLLLGLWMCRECFQGVLIFSLLHDVSEWRVLAKYQRFVADRNEQESSSVHQE